MSHVFFKCFSHECIFPPNEEQQGETAEGLQSGAPAAKTIATSTLELSMVSRSPVAESFAQADADVQAGSEYMMSF